MGKRSLKFLQDHRETRIENFNRHRFLLALQEARESRIEHLLLKILAGLLLHINKGPGLIIRAGRTFEDIGESPNRKLSDVTWPGARNIPTRWRSDPIGAFFGAV